MIDDATMERLFHPTDERRERRVRHISELMPALLAKYAPAQQPAPAVELEFAAAHLTACVLS